MKRAAVIVAGGSGTRMGSEVPKQFLLVAGKPILQHTLEVFHRFDEDMCLVLVLPHSQMAYWENLCFQYACSVPHLVAEGGETRFHSVKNGLAMVPDDVEYIGVHDGVRPLVSMDTLKRCFSGEAEAIVPVIDLNDSIRYLYDGGSQSVDRSSYKAVQTPQVFLRECILSAYNQPYEAAFTDDASVVEKAGHAIELTVGNRENIKITTPLDLRLAEWMLKDGLS